MAWYSWMFIVSALVGAMAVRQSLTAAHSDRTDATDLSNIGLLVRVHLDLDHLLDAACADDHRHADIEVVDPVLAGQVGGAGQQPALVLEIALGHLDGRGRRRVEGRAGLQQRHDLRTAVAGALHDRVQPLLRGPAHLDQIRQRNAGHGRVAHQRHHGVAVAAQHERGHVLDRDLELLGQKIAEARAVEHAGHAHHLVPAAKPVTFCIAQTIASSGLVMTMTKASGAYCLMLLADAS